MSYLIQCWHVQGRLCFFPFSTVFILVQCGLVRLRALNWPGQPATPITWPRIASERIVRQLFGENHLIEPEGLSGLWRRAVCGGDTGAWHLLHSGLEARHDAGPWHSAAVDTRPGVLGAKGLWVGGLESGVGEAWGCSPFAGADQCGWGTENVCLWLVAEHKVGSRS